MLVGSRDRFRHLFEQPAGALAAARVTPYESVTSVPADAEEAAPPDPVEPPDLDLLGDQIAELSARIQAATYELLCHLREFDRHCGWEGFRSCAHWLNWRTGLNLGAAREKLRVAAALAELNHVSAAMACGVLSYSKVRAITRVADTANEARLVAVACGATAEQVERLVRAWRRADRTADADAEQMRLASRSLSTRVDEDGMVVLRGRLTPEVGAVLLRALEAALEQVPAAAEDGAPTVAQRRADALGLVAESALAGKLDPGNPGDRFQVTVHVDPETLPAREPATATPDVSAETPAGSPAAAEPAAPAAGPDAGLAVIEQASGIHLSAAAARRVACDAGLVVLRHAPHGEVLDGGRRTRIIPTALRRALEGRDRNQCQFPGCNCRRGTIPVPAPGWRAAAGGATGSPLAGSTAGADRGTLGGGRHHHRSRYRYPRVVRRVAGRGGGARGAVGTAGCGGARRPLTEPARRTETPAPVERTAIYGAELACVGGSAGALE